MKNVAAATSIALLAPACTHLETLGPRPPEAETAAVSMFAPTTEARDQLRLALELDEESRLKRLFETAGIEYKILPEKNDPKYESSLWEFSIRLGQVQSWILDHCNSERGSEYWFTVRIDERIRAERDHFYEEGRKKRDQELQKVAEKYGVSLPAEPERKGDILVAEVLKNLGGWYREMQESLLKLRGKFGKNASEGERKLVDQKLRAMESEIYFSIQSRLYGEKSRARIEKIKASMDPKWRGLYDALGGIGEGPLASDPKIREIYKKFEDESNFETERILHAEAKSRAGKFPKGYTEEWKSRITKERKTRVKTGWEKWEEAVEREIEGQILSIEEAGGHKMPPEERAKFKEHLMKRARQRIEDQKKQEERDRKDGKQPVPDVRDDNSTEGEPETAREDLASSSFSMPSEFDEL